MIGNRLDRYEILQKVGEGGMAVVYRGRHVMLGRDVAVKVLHPFLSSSTRNRQRFAREARAIEQLDHENIVQIYDYSGIDSEACYIVTEFVEGVTLQELVAERGALPSETVSMVGIALARALGYAHRRGIVHRDLKPENVMIRKDGVLKLMDFGIARFLDDSQVTLTGTLVGSPAYMSPEQAQEKGLDSRSDLFSLGVVLFYLASGELPFRGSNPSTILKNIIEGRRPQLIELRPEVSPTLADAVEKLLQTDPERRPADAGELEALLQRSLDEVEVRLDDPRWSLRRYLTDPDGCREELEQHLRGVLLRRGRELLDAGETLEALRMLNRLLAMDPDNEEVLGLVQGLHPEPGREAVPWWRFSVAAVGLALLGVVLLLLLRGGSEKAPPQLPPGSPGGEPEARDELAAAGDEGKPRQVPGTPGGAGASAEEREEPSGEAGDAGAPGAASRAGAVSGQDGGEPAAVATRRSKVPVDVQPMQRFPDLSKLKLRRLPSAAPEKATVRVTLERVGRNDTTWAEIYIDGQYRDITGRKPIEVEPGTHVLELRNPYTSSYRVEFTVEPGEEKVFQGIRLQSLPATVRVGEGIGGDCEVLLDGTPLGTVETLGGSFSLPSPRSRHEVAYLCPGVDAIRYETNPVEPGSTLTIPEVP